MFYGGKSSDSFFRWYRIPLNWQTTHFFLSPAKEHLNCFRFGDTTNNTSVNILVHVVHALQYYPSHHSLRVTEYAQVSLSKYCSTVAERCVTVHSFQPCLRRGLHLYSPIRSLCVVTQSVRFPLAMDQVPFDMHCLLLKNLLKGVLFGIFLLAWFGLPVFLPICVSLIYFQNFKIDSGYESCVSYVLLLF